MVRRVSTQPRLLSTSYEKWNALLFVQLPPSAGKYKSAAWHWTYEHININFGGLVFLNIYLFIIFIFCYFIWKKNIKNLHNYFPLNLKSADL